jgi:cell division protein FtsA
VSAKYVVGLDIGTTKICAMVARVEAGAPEIMGIGLAGTSGLKKGVVVDIEVTTEAIRKAVSDAEASSGVEIRAAYVGVAGSHIDCLESYGATGIKGAEVTRGDLERVMDSAAALYLPLDREVLHVLPTDFVIDGQGGIVRPLGMAGARLEANVRVITASHSAVENIAKCCRKAGVDVVATVFQPIASSHAVAHAEELEAGVAVVDVGGGTTDVAVYKEGGLVHASVLPVGGNHITNDIAVGLRVSQGEAERVKKEHGFVVGEIDSGELIDITLMNGEQRQVPRHYLKEISRPRCEETLRIISGAVETSADLSGPSCVVLTGGTALMEGLDRVAEAIFGLPVRIGTPHRGVAPQLRDRLASPVYATGVGLVLYGCEAERNSYDGVIDGIVRKVKGKTRNLLEVKGWGIRRRFRRAEVRG